MLAPEGEFYLRRVLQDDVSERVLPLTTLDPMLTARRVAEAIAVGLVLVRGLGWDPDDTRLGFLFRWTKLDGRHLSAWASPNVMLTPSRFHASEDTKETFVQLSLDTPVNALAPIVQDAT